MIILVSFLGFISIFIAINILLKLLLKGRLQLASRLHTIKGETNAKENINELDTPFFDRVIRPIGDRLSMIISKTTPGGLKERIHSKLIMAGNPLNISVSRWILIKISFMLFFTSISWGSAMATIYFNIYIIFISKSYINQLNSEKKKENSKYITRCS
jgi:tight adherence protein C